MREKVSSLRGAVFNRTVGLRTACLGAFGYIATMSACGAMEAHDQLRRIEEKIEIAGITAGSDIRREARIMSPNITRPSYLMSESEMARARELDKRSAETADAVRASLREENAEIMNSLDNSRYRLGGVVSLAIGMGLIFAGIAGGGRSAAQTAAGISELDDPARRRKSSLSAQEVIKDVQGFLGLKEAS